MIRLALQTKGRLNEESLAIIREAGIKVEDSKRKLLSRASNFPLEILYLRDDDIPHAVAAGIADIGIVGENEVAEKGFKVDVLQKLGFGKCRISLAIPKGESYEDLSYFRGKRIATSYPNILGEFFTSNGIKADIEEIAGSVEIAPAVGIADAIFDIVSSGGTLISNGLKEVEKVFYSEAALIATPGLGGEKGEILSRLLFRLGAVERSRGKKYLMINIPQERIDEAVSILPGMKSPTVLPLAQNGWCSIHTVVGEGELWEVVGALKAIGAEDILVLSLEKMVL